MLPFNIVLVAPEIPQNTGTIGRLCVSTETRLHLVRPLGFSLEDKYVKRAGMDYWPHLDLTIYENWEEFLKKNPEANLLFISTKGETCFWDAQYRPGDYLVFGPGVERTAAGILRPLPFPALPDSDERPVPPQSQPRQRGQHRAVRGAPRQP